MSDDILRFGLMDKRTVQTREPVKTNDLVAIHAIAARKNVALAAGNNIVTNEFGRWLAELDQIVLKLTDSAANLVGLNYWIQSNLQTIKLAKKRSCILTKTSGEI